MRIISRFRDYYDRGMDLGADGTRAFLRETSEYSEESSTYPMPSYLVPLLDLLKRDLRVGDVSLSPFLIAFAGKLYPGVRCLVVGSAADTPPSQTVKEIVYDEGGLIGFCAAHSVDLNKRGLFDRQTTEQRFQAFFGLRGTTRGAELLVKEGVAIAVAVARRPGHVLVNPSLKPFEFFRVFDAWQAYQELDVYLGSLASPDTKPPVTVSDTDRILQHGFNKQSFRKRPQHM